MSLQFFGDWSIWFGFPAALLAGGATWYFYNREVKARKDRLRWLLPLLRSLTVFFLILMLTGPVIHHRQTIGQFARILLFVDASKSMSIDDAALTPSRKLLTAIRLGWIPADLLPNELSGFEKLLMTAQQASTTGVNQAPNNPIPLRRAANDALSSVEEAYALLRNLPPENLAGMAPRGSALFEYWEGMDGNSVNNLRRAPGFPNNPTGSAQVRMLEGRRDWKDKYGAKISGYLYPPLTGQYIFFLVANEEAEFYLSKDENTAGLQKLLTARSNQPNYEWDGSQPQRSSGVALDSSKRYYFEILYKEDTGSEYLALGWQMPDGRRERPIPGQRLSPARPELEEAAKDRPVSHVDFERNLLNPLKTLQGRDPAADLQGYYSELKAIDQTLSNWRARVRTAYEPWGQRLVEARHPEAMQAIERFDTMNRWQRLESLMFEGGNPLLTRLAADHHVELITLSEKGMEPIWQARAGETINVEDLPERFNSLPETPFTNLTTAIQETVSRSGSTGAEDKVAPERMVGVLFTDGRHNVGSSPLEAASIAGGRNIPIYTIGVGSESAIKDMAILEIDMPQSIYIKDRVTGKIRIKSGLSAGNRFSLRLSVGGETAWTKTEQTTGDYYQVIEFSFPVEPLAEKLMELDAEDIKRRTMPLVFTASLSPPAGMDMLDENNYMNHPVQVSFRMQKILIIDGRARWEYRYIRNLFDRDEKWTVTSVLPKYPRGEEPKLERGSDPDQFPASREDLMGYDLIILGDIDAAMFTEEELGWMNEFITRTGGGLILMDGQRNHLKSFENTPLRGALPVTWVGGGGPASGLHLTDKGHLRLTERGTGVNALALKGDRQENAAVWASFEPPHFAANVKEKPGAEVLVTATIDDKQTPGIVQMRYGAGVVYYQAFSESWRWRKRVGGQYHDPYWNQVGRLVMPPPFAVSDETSSLDSGGILYGPDDTIEIRAQLREPETNRPTITPKLSAVIKELGTTVATVPLEGDQERMQYYGAISGLKRGEYTVTLSAQGFPNEQIKTETIFHVATPGGNEMAEVSSDVERLRQISENSLAEYLQEEEAMLLPARLKPLSEGKVVETDTILWQHYLWLVWIVILLSIEAILRKRSGLL